MASTSFLTYHARHVNHFFRSLLFKAIPAAIVTGFPGKKLHIYGITGTDGKTTSSTLLYHTLKTAGYKVALISTVAAFIGDEEIDTGFHVTSPEPWAVQRLLKRCVDEGITHVVLEVTSHGVFQYRIWGIEFAYVGVTNITREHLDYFVDYPTYLGVKAELLLAAKKSAFLNADDASFAPLAKIFADHHKSFKIYSQELGKTALDEAIRRRFPEPYNRWNAKLVSAMATAIGVSSDVQEKAIASFTGVRGRMEKIEDPQGRHIIVDFAHTPNGLEQALRSLRLQTKGKLIAVFGCAGLRDHTKRPVMGRLGSEIADFCVFTSEDPRTESIQTIFRQMKEGIGPQDHAKVVTQPDRREAIKLALSQAKKGDIVGVFGKGHEKSLAFGKTEVPWSDQVAIRELLKEGV